VRDAPEIGRVVYEPEEEHFEVVREWKCVVLGSDGFVDVRLELGVEVWWTNSWSYR
jgi:hypothetical protein